MDILEEVENDDNEQFQEMLRKKRLGIVDMQSDRESIKIDTNPATAFTNKPQKETKFKHGSVTVQARPSANAKDRRALLAQLANAPCNSSAMNARTELLNNKRLVRESGVKKISMNGRKVGAPLADFAVAKSFRGKPLPHK